MSWLYSQALVEEYLGESCLGGEQSALLNGNPTQQAYCALDKMTDFSRLSRFGMTFKPLTENRGEELLTLFLEASRAKTLVQQEEVQELKESDLGCGNIWRESSEKWNQLSLLSKTPLCSALEDSVLSSKTLPRWGMMLNGECYQQPKLELTTKEKGCGLSEKWPTPDANCGKRGTQPEWTPKRKTGQASQYTINQVVRDRMMFPTPTCHNAKEGAYPAEYTRKTPTLATHAGGKLNPMWVEWLMGWPLGWTDLKPLEMDKFHCVQQQHGDC